MPNVYETYQPPASEGGTWLKLEDGESAKIRLTSEPYLVTKVFKDRESGEEKINTRYVWVVYNRLTKVGQILEAGVLVYKQVANYATDEDWGDPSEYDMTIKREGTGTDTRYYLTPSPKRIDLTVEERNAVMAVDLKNAYKDTTPIPLSQVQSAPVKNPVPTPATVTSDVVIKDLDTTQTINLEDIPF
jgi:hypothetical protein